MHAEPNDLHPQALAMLAGARRAGVVLAGPTPAALAQARAAGVVAADAGYWQRHRATPQQPLSPAIDPTGLFPTTLDDFAAQMTANGADLVLAPSGLIEADDWPAVAAVARACSQTARADVVPLFALDAAMIEPHRVARLAAVLRACATSPAIVLADKSQPLARPGRVNGLRQLVGAVPGLAVLATDSLVALDVAARGGAAAIGYRQSLRQPRRPQDRGKGGPMSAGRLPGLFLRELLEHRNPNIYADWHINRPSPRCGTCGRPLDVFSTSAQDKARILQHNVHAWQQMLSDMQRRNGLLRQQQFLVAARLAALQRHVSLHPNLTNHCVDAVLRQQAQDDDPMRCQVRTSGAFA